MNAFERLKPVKTIYNKSEYIVTLFDGRPTSISRWVPAKSNRKAYLSRVNPRDDLFKKVLETLS